jgi:hypothetical protein
MDSGQGECRFKEMMGIRENTFPKEKTAQFKDESLKKNWVRERM